MSIAVSAVIRTPVGLRLLQAGMGICALLAALPLSGGWPLEHAPWLSAGYALGWFSALPSACGGVFLLALSCRRTKQHTLDISPVGQLRMTVYLDHGAGADDRGCTAGQGYRQRHRQEPMRSLLQLLPASTLWPGWLLLRLGSEEGRVLSLLVWRGARSCPAFRTLAVACHAIAARRKGE